MLVVELSMNAHVRKWGGLVVFLAIALAGHTEALPKPLQAYGEWFEFAGLLAGFVRVYFMLPASAQEREEKHRPVA
jgi:hypothetical protein